MHHGFTVVGIDNPSEAQICDLYLIYMLLQGGKYFFAEHILDFKPGFRRILQRVFDRLWALTFEGCHFRYISVEFLKAKVFPEENIP